MPHVAMTLLGLAYQQRARETGDPVLLPEVRRASSGARCALDADDLARDQRARLARTLAPPASAGARLGRQRAAALADHRAQLRRDRRRARRARPLRRGVRRFDTMARAQAEPRRLRARLLRPRAARRRPRARSRRCSSRSMPPRPAGGGRLDARPAREALLVHGPDRARRRASTAPRSRPSPATSTRSTRSRRSRRRRAARPRDRARAASGRRDPAAAVRRRARRPLRASPATAAARGGSTR